MTRAPYYQTDGLTLHLGDSLHILPTLDDASVDAIICDPPYGLADHPPHLITAALTAWLGGDRAHVPDGRGFMGADWDRFVPPPAIWDQCLRVLKPGGHLAAFAGARTADLMGLAIRLAGFEVRDSLHWFYGSGFPKSLDVSKAIDNSAGAQRALIPATGGLHKNANLNDDGWSKIGSEAPLMAGPDPVTPDAARWQGWGTALKPAHEPIILARKPLAGTVAGNVLTHGTGALNIDGCRTPSEPVRTTRNTALGVMNDDGWQPKPGVFESHAAGRWPTNVLLAHPPLLDGHGQPIGDACADGCAPGCPVAEMDAQSGVRTSGSRKEGTYGLMGYMGADAAPMPAVHGDSGGASRFFPVFRYEAKAPASERPRLPDGTAHPTVKPLALLAWLVRLLTPPGGLVLDPFAGSGTTLEAAAVEGFRAVGIERHEPYAELCRVRLSKPLAPVLFGDVA